MIVGDKILSTSRHNMYDFVPY